MFFRVNEETASRPNKGVIKHIMSLRKHLSKEVEVLENEIRELEIKRMRSMSALVEALVTHTEPDPVEMQFFRTFTTEIENRRKKIIATTNKLNEMD